MHNAKDLTKEPPRSPRLRLGGYALLARAIDKCRATLAGTVGEYHFNCPLDQMLFGFKGVDADDFKANVESGVTDEEIATWLDDAGILKSDEEIKEWGDGLEGAHPYEDPEKREWFAEQVAPLGLDPATTTLFDYLEADDRATHGTT